LAKKPYQQPAVPTKDFSFGFQPFAPLPEKKVSCPKCGKVGEITGKRSAEGQFIFKCKGCNIEYSQHLKLGFCAFGVNEKNGKWLVEKSTKERVFVRSMVPSQCRACPKYEVFMALKEKCPFFKGVIGRELEPPEQWVKT